MAFQNPGQVDARYGIYHETRGDQFTINITRQTINLNIDGNHTSSPVASTKATRLAQVAPPELLIDFDEPPLTLPEIQTSISADGDCGGLGGIRAFCYPQMEQPSAQSTSGTCVHSGTIRSAVTDRISQFKAEDGSINMATLEGLIEHLMTGSLRRRISLHADRLS